MKKFVQNIRMLQELSKSGIVTLVLISVLAGYAIGYPAEHSFNFFKLLITLLGILFLAAGSSALNQYQEREIDIQMPRTAARPLPSGRISTKKALSFIGIFLILGLFLLLYLSPILFYLGLLAIFFYNGLYTLWWKKNWAYAAIPGAIPGALPILMGHYSGQIAPHGQCDLFDPGALYIFFILFFWQMPHFWALALRYESDYKKGGFPTLPVKFGPQMTLHHITTWCLAYLALALVGPFFLKVKWIYFIPSLLVSLKVLYELYGFLQNPKSQKWLHFFLWINFSLIFYLLFAVIDLWIIYLPIPNFTR